MALEDFSIGGKTFAELKVTDAILETAATAGGSLTLTLGRSVNAAQAFPSYTDVELTENDTVRWRGRLDRRSSRAAGGSERHQLVFRSKFRSLESVRFKQSVWVSQVNSFKELTTVMLNLGWEVTVEGGAVVQKKLTSNQQLTLIKEQLATRGITLTGTLPELRPPYVVKENASIISCLLTLLSWHPSYALRDNLGTLELVNTEGTPERSFDPAVTRLALANIDARDDILYSETRIIYLRTRNGQVTAFHEDVATTANGSDHKWLETITLEDNEVYPDDGLAEQNQKWVGKLKLDTQVEIPDGLYWEIQEGDRVKLAGALPDFGTDNTVVQTITRSLKGRGRVSLQCGARNHLGLDKLIEYNRKTPHTAPDGGGGPEDPDTGKIEVVIQGLDTASLATWSVGDQVGSGDDTVEVDVGTYNAVFNPVYDGSRFFFAKAVSGLEVTRGSTQVATADYEEAFLGGTKPFQLVRVDDSTFKVLPSTIGFKIPPGMEAGNAPTFGSAGSGYIYGVVNYSASTGVISGVEVNTYSGEQESSDGTLYLAIGHWSNDGETVTLTNYSFGPINVQTCRDWFTESGEAHYSIWAN